ncbi:hypothetical protein [Marinitenerispora sediminis]|uniref:Uncharacterized protein n=1 Tax=Marinitenerispora sediminis TaxID=1931232 RepID=A0A368T4A6_9ACTN|nr:hypothetical protein [Marinitenerispora sediminis]RCV58238.1 hypothetical protein DEF24_13965 [Marinitenerispora sediminis]
MKKTVRRILVTGIVAPALALGLPAVAFADSSGFSAQGTFAGPFGASTSSVNSFAGGWGGWDGGWGGWDGGWW